MSATRSARRLAPHRRVRRLALASMILVTPAALPSGAAAERPDTPGTTEIFRYEAGDVVERYDAAGGAFRVHFTRAGMNAVPLPDDDGSGFPDSVERVAEIYEEVLAFYVGELGFRAPLSDETLPDAGGDGRFDVYLLDFGGSADGAFRTDGCGVGGALPTQCVGFMVQENDFAGYGYPSVEYANRLLASHELFHAVQAAYDSDEGSVLSEGTAVWASAAFDPSLRDLEGFASGYLDNTARPIDRPLPGPIDPFSYGTGIFFRFLDERFSGDILRSLWEACETDAWLPALDDLLQAEHGSSFSDAFREFAEWNLFTWTSADPSRSYADGARYPPVQIEPVELPYRLDPLRVFYASAQYVGAHPGGRSEITAALVGDAEGLELWIAVRRGGVIELASGHTVDASGAEEVIVVVQNPAREGDARRPGLCIGRAAEVAACRADLEAPPDAGSTMEDDAGLVADAGPTPGAEAGCACAAPGSPALRSRSVVDAWACASLGLLVSARRRRARRTRAR